MKYNPQNLTRSVRCQAWAIPAAMLLASVFQPISLAQQETQSPAPQTTAAVVSDLKPSDKSAGEVLAAVQKTLDSAEAFSCDIRQLVLMSGRKLSAVGKYAQASGNRTRLEYRLYAFDVARSEDADQLKLDAPAPDASKLKKTGSLTQVNDGSVLWSYWDNAGQQLLTRRNVQEIVDAATNVEGYGKVGGLKDMGIGGLQALLASIQGSMEFGAVQQQTVAGSTFDIVSGRWNAEYRKTVLKIPDEAQVLPDFVPEYVRIYVDQSNNLVRRIQYLKRHPDPNVKQITPMTTVDFLNPRLNTDVSDQLFVFKQPKEGEGPEVVDVTAEVIDQLKRRKSDQATSQESTNDTPDKTP